MLKLLIFDLDGVLSDSRELHYKSLNAALATIDARYVIHEDDMATYEALPTKEKLTLLTKYKQLPTQFYDKIYHLKQRFTVEMIESTIQRDEKCIALFDTLCKQYKLVCASNSIWKTVQRTLSQLGILNYFDYFISNEDVTHSKPHPEMFYQCMSRFDVSPHNTLIFEDSPVGRQAAYACGAHVCPIINPHELTLSKVNHYIAMVNEHYKPPKMNIVNFSAVAKCNIVNPSAVAKCNIVIPMAGLGSRFVSAGYKTPKPFIRIDGKPMIQRVVENLNMDGRYIFIVHHDYVDSLTQLFESVLDDYIVIPVSQVTQGAACSVLLAKPYIDNEMPLIIVNSDQYVEWDSQEFLYVSSHTDGCLLTFTDTQTKWSYAKVVDDRVVEVREKEVISNHATVGIYYWRCGSIFVQCANQMIQQNKRVNNEFYVCPVFNELVEAGGDVKIFDCLKMWSLGVPEDLEYFMTHYLRCTEEVIQQAKC